MKALISPSDKFFIAGATGMAGGSIARALTRAGYGKQAEGGALITPPRTEVDLLDAEAVDSWFGNNSPSVVVLAAATVGAAATASPGREVGTPQRRCVPPTQN